MKIYLIKEFKEFPYESWDEILTVNSWYYGDLVPIMYDPQTLQPAPPVYIIKCNDGKFRKVSSEYFITEQEKRDKTIDNLLEK
jgi:hypothetical protein